MYRIVKVLLMMIHCLVVVAVQWWTWGDHWFYWCCGNSYGRMGSSPHIPNLWQNSDCGADTQTNVAEGFFKALKWITESITRTAYLPAHAVKDSKKRFHYRNLVLKTVPDWLMENANTKFEIFFFFCMNNYLARHYISLLVETCIPASGLWDSFG